MPEQDRLLGMYLHLARASHMRRQPMVRDKLLVLAGVQAEQMGLEPISQLCRHRILASNARHLLRQWPTVTAAMADDEFQSYLKQLKRRYSGEKIEHMLDSLGIELGREREAYFSDLEYAAALLDTKPEAIDAIVAGDPTAHTNGHVTPEHTERSSAPRGTLPDVAIVWAPLVAGLVAVALVAVFSLLRLGQ